MSTRELVEFGVDFVRRMRAQSVAWLTARVLAIYGECPTYPATFPWWLASILPVKDEEKYKLLGTSSVRERLKMCCKWIIEWESNRWLVSYSPLSPFTPPTLQKKKNQKNSRM